MVNRIDLKSEYISLVKKFGFNIVDEAPRILSVIRKSISEFVKQHKNVAVYCNGYHTRMLMSDFVFELKKVRFIIDNNAFGDRNEGFVIISASEMEANEIDGVIISSYDYMDSIVDSMIRDYPRISYLNIYSKIRESGIDLHSAYYENAHPYHHYKRINNLQMSIAQKEGDKSDLYLDLIGEYVRIKDFRTALYKSREWGNAELAENLKNMYQKELDAARMISDNNVLMLCLDGLKRTDLSKRLMPKMYEYIVKNGRLFTNAYSFSTSTFESLIPAFSENMNSQRNNSDENTVKEGKCRFVEEAKRQHREMYFYTDMADFIEAPLIRRSNKFQTATEKLWDFVIDASSCSNGLFNVHILYESHYSFVNPYTNFEILAEGTALLFDFLDIKGGKLRADYICQHNDAMRYLDDVVTPILEAINCRLVIFADHGNTLLPKTISIADVSVQYLTCHEDLIEIPLAVIDRISPTGENRDLISLMEINNIVISLLQNKPYNNPQNNWIRIGRSKIYNPDFQYLYNKMGEKNRLQAFDGYVFDSKEKLIIYADDRMELYSTVDDSMIEDDDRINELIQLIKGDY